jgi:hypothetical protein
MTLGGPQVLAALDEALRDIRREEDDILRKLGRGLERLAKVREAEGELLRQMAHGRLTPELEARLGDDVVRTGTEARQALKQRASAMAATAAGLKVIELRVAEQLAARATMLAEITEQQASLRALSPRIAAAVARDPAYEAQRQTVLHLKQVAEAARAKARQADLDRELKGRPFRSDPLFSYLLQRQYGTPAYRAGRITAWLDGRVAALVGYGEARAQYAVLNELPGQLRAHADRQAERAAAAEEELDNLERAAIDAAGGGTLRTALAAAQEAITAIDRELLSLQDERDRAVAVLRRLTAPDASDFEAALRALSRALATTVPTGAEDGVGLQLNDLRLRIAEEQADGREQQARLETLAARRHALEDIGFEFKTHRFDDPRSVLRDDDLIGSRLDEVLTGAVGAETYWALLQRAQGWSAGTSDWGGGVGLPRHGREALPANAPSPAARFSRPRPGVLAAEA